MRTMPRLLLLLFCMSVVTMMFIARCGISMDGQLYNGQAGGLPLSSRASPGEKALREVMRRKEVEFARDKTGLQKKIKALETQLAKVQWQVVNLTITLRVAEHNLTRAQSHSAENHAVITKSHDVQYAADDGNINMNNARGFGNLYSTLTSNKTPRMNPEETRPLYLDGFYPPPRYRHNDKSEQNTAADYPHRDTFGDIYIDRWRHVTGAADIDYRRTSQVDFTTQTHRDNVRSIISTENRPLGHEDRERANDVAPQTNAEGKRLQFKDDMAFTGGDSHSLTDAGSYVLDRSRRSTILGGKQGIRLSDMENIRNNTRKTIANESELIELQKYLMERLKMAEIVKGQSYKTEYELIPFNRFIFNRIFLVDPGLGKRVVEKPIGSKKKDLNEILFHAVETLNKNRSENSQFTYNDFIEGMYRSDPASGSHYELFFSNKDDKSFKRPRSYIKLSIFRPFAPPVTVQQTIMNTASQWINLILPLSNRVDTFRIFMNQFVAVCIKRDKRIFLTVVYFGTEGLTEVKSIMNLVAKTHKFKHMKLVTLNETFTRGRGLQIGATNWKGADVLFFFCDVDIIFTSDFLERCRLNTDRGHRVYYPIVFSLYNPKIVYSLQDVPLPSLQDQLVVAKDAGFWRDFGYGMACLYRSDFLKIKGFDEQITGWGGEDVFLYQKFVRSEYLVIRATDPAIFHLWHEKVCDPMLSTEQYRSCIRSKALNEASHAQLGLLAFKDEIDIHIGLSEGNSILHYNKSG